MSKRDASNDVPFSAMSNNLHIEMLGQKQLSMDGDFTIIEYTEEAIKIKLKKGYIQIYGTNLIINNINDENLLITGKILSLEFVD